MKWCIRWYPKEKASSAGDGYIWRTDQWCAGLRLYDTPEEAETAARAESHLQNRRD